MQCGKRRSIGIMVCNSGLSLEVVESVSGLCVCRLRLLECLSEAGVFLSRGTLFAEAVC